MTQTQQFEHKKTELGLELVEFEDENGKICSIQQHSKDRKCLFVGLGGFRMYMKRSDVQTLVQTLQRWLATGSFEE